MFNKQRPHADFETAQCPVCRFVFGRRDTSAIYKAHCSECRVTFWWKPWAEKPTALLDRDAERRKCGCLSCEAKGH